MVNIGSTSVGGRVVGIKGESVARLSLTLPVCTKEEEKVALSRRVEGHWRLIGWGRIMSGVQLQSSGGTFTSEKSA